jgi:carbonic anhydrase
MQRLLDGYAHFRSNVFPHHSSLFQQLAHGQTPEVCLITCSDSRVMPELILQCDPGQIFAIRNAGNLVPLPGEAHSGVAASVEYAVRALNVADIVICGHSGCGAMKEVLDQQYVYEMPMVTSWLRHAGPSPKWLSAMLEDTTHLSDERKLELITQANVISQLGHLSQHPSVAEALTKGSLRLHGWIYDIPTGEILVFDQNTGGFIPLATDAAKKKIA